MHEKSICGMSVEPMKHPDCQSKICNRRNELPVANKTG